MKIAEGRPFKSGESDLWCRGGKYFVTPALVKQGSQQKLGPMLAPKSKGTGEKNLSMKDFSVARIHLGVSIGIPSIIPLHPLNHIVLHVGGSYVFGGHNHFDKVLSQGLVPIQDPLLNGLLILSRGIGGKSKGDGFL